MAHNTPLNVLPQRDGRNPSPGPRFLGDLLALGGGRKLQEATSLYIHVPFCFHKCHYCDFYSIVDTQDRQGVFTERLIREIHALGPLAGGSPLQTIFVGGGTPSLLAVPLWERLLRALGEAFDLSAIRGRGRGGELAEFTVECNPETVTPELMGTLRGGGVTRVSMGAQSFNRHHLKTLERWHDPENVERAIEMAKAAGIARQSIDLIFGVPGQTVEDWEADLARGLALGTEHISCYSLTYEPNTAMTARLKRGEFAAMDEDVEVQMHRSAWRLVREKGLERYEVSNFARAGAECRHNLAYWRQESWLAAGPSASGHLRCADGLSGYRWKNTPRLDDYLSIEDDSHTGVLAEHEMPDAGRAVRERIMTGLRLAEGVDGGAIARDAERLKAGAASKIEKAARGMVSGGLMVERDGRWVLTDEGILFADGLAVEMFGAMD